MKSGIDYFPLDCQLDDKFELIEAEFGLKGFAVIVKLFQKIYSGEGYYCIWTKEVGLLFARKINADYSLVSEIISASIKRGIFDKKLFEKHQILTSSGIQKRYLEAVSRRKKVEVRSEYLLLCNTQIYKNVDILSENADNSKKNADISKQSKVEESKVKESRGEESNSPDGAAPLLPQSDYDSIVSEYGKEITDRYVLKMETYIKEHRNGKPYKAPAAMIRKWISEDKPKVSKETTYDLNEIEEYQKNYLLNRKKKLEGSTNDFKV